MRRADGKVEPFLDQKVMKRASIDDCLHWAQRKVDLISESLPKEPPGKIEAMEANRVARLQDLIETSRKLYTEVAHLAVPYR